MTSLASRAIPHYTKPWQLLVSVCVTRANRIPRPLTPLEEKYAKMQQEQELERSVYGDVEKTRSTLKATINQLQGGMLTINKN